MTTDVELKREVRNRNLDAEKLFLQLQAILKQTNTSVAEKIRENLTWTCKEHADQIPQILAAYLDEARLQELTTEVIGQLDQVPFSIDFESSEAKSHFLASLRSELEQGGRSLQNQDDKEMQVVRILTSLGIVPYHKEEVDTLIAHGSQIEIKSTT